MKCTRPSAFALLLVSALFMGCGAGKGMYVTVTRPAEVNLKNYDRIAVGVIKGSESGVLSAISDLVEVAGGGVTRDEGSQLFFEDLMQALFDSGRFEVLDHENLKTALSQNDLVMSSLTDGAKEEEIRKIFGNIALISGNISEHDYDEDVDSEESERKDKETGKITTTRKYTRTGTARVRVSLRIVDLRTSQILVNRKFKESRSESKSMKNSRPGPINRRPLFEGCREEIISSFMRMIVPYTERVYVAFETAKEMPDLERGINTAKLGNWNAASQIFQRVTQAHASSPLVHKAYYNLGLSYMYADQFDNARTALEEAYAAKPESKYKEAIDELMVRIEDKRRLEEQSRVDPEAEEGDSDPMEEQGQPDAEGSDDEALEMQGQSEAGEGTDSTPMKEQR